MQSQEIKYIIQTSKQVTTIQYICPNGSLSLYIYIHITHGELFFKITHVTDNTCKMFHLGV
jgi:hypothetical protein